MLSLNWTGAIDRHTCTWTLRVCDASHIWLCMGASQEEASGGILRDPGRTTWPFLNQPQKSQEFPSSSVLLIKQSQACSYSQESGIELTS